MATAAPLPAPHRHRWLAIIAGVNALAAWGGAIGLASGALALGDRLNERLPFDSPVFGGAALAWVVAGPLSLLTLQAWSRQGHAGPVAVVAGGLLVGWILVQLAFLRELSFFHPLYFAMGVVLIVCGLHVSDEDDVPR